MVVQGVRLHQVDDVESVGFTCPRIGHSEVVPLSVTSSVIIGFENEIILKLVNLNGSS